jgi:RND family efflux transporter MFP subunit
MKRPLLRTSICRTSIGLAAACGLASVAFLQPEATAQESSVATIETFVGITRPSKSYELAFSNLGKVAEVPVKAGQMTREGALLMRQEAELEEARLEELRAEADVSGRVETASKQAELAKIVYDRIAGMFDSGGSTQSELEQARLEEIVARFRIDEEQRQGVAAEARVKQLEVQISQKALYAPASGVIRQVEAQVGEIHGPSQPAIELVVIDPVKIEVLNVEPSDVAKLTQGDVVQVRYAGEDEWLDATVSFIDPIARPEVNEQLIKLDLPNPDRRPAGLEVEVRLAD